MLKISKNIIIIETNQTGYNDADEIENAILNIENSGFNEIKIDLSQVTFLSSKTLGMFMMSKERLTKNNINFSITSISNELLETFKNLKLVDYFQINTQL